MTIAVNVHNADREGIAQAPNDLMWKRVRRQARGITMWSSEIVRFLDSCQAFDAFEQEGDANVAAR